MEAIAALGLACNILQVAETGLKLAQVFRKAYKHDSVKDNEDAVRLSDNMSSAIGELQISMQQPLSKNDSELNDIAVQCLEKATKLRAVLDPALQSTSSRRRDKLKKGFKAVQLSFSSDVKDLETEIQTLRQDLDTRVLISLRSRYDLASTQQAVNFASLRDDVQIFIRQQTDLQHQRTRQAVQEESTKISNQLQSMNVSAGDRKTRDKLLNSLFFPDMNARKNQISAAHPDTFEWLFGKSHNSFQEWLKTGQRVYWISGKPGSGKSTLMNFIVEHKLTREYLRQWSTSQDLVLLQSYLWNAGAENQRTYRGVLATLLTQLLTRSSGLIDSLLHHDSALSQKSTSMDWSVRELERCLFDCLNSNDTYFCIFVDGLDEAETDSTASANPILRFIETVAGLTNVKCCVSSRQLQQFELAFKDVPCLRLQDLNDADIRKYFDDNAGPILKGAGMDNKDANFETLQYEFSRKADGVFLWACLAVGSLNRGARNCDDFDELRRRLETLPPELEDLYCHMWGQENKDVRLYQEEASLFLRISLYTVEDQATSQFPLSPLYLVFTRPSNYYLSEQALVGKVSKELEQACKHIRAQILSRCAGLLEVAPSDQFPPEEVEEHERGLSDFPALQAAHTHRVKFVHRTARDFLLTSAFGQRICSASQLTEFQLRRLVCRARLCAIMIFYTTPPPREFRWLMAQIVQDHSLHQEDAVVLGSDVENAFKDRVLSSQQHLDENNWFTFCDLRSEKWLRSTRFAHDFLGAMLCAGASWSVRDKLNHIIQGNPAYRLYLMLCWFVCHGGVWKSPRRTPDGLLDVFWSHSFCSEELLRHVAYTQSFDSRIMFPVRISVGEILLHTLREFPRSGLGNAGLPLSFLESLFTLPFPQDQELFLIGNLRTPRGDGDGDYSRWAVYDGLVWPETWKANQMKPVEYRHRQLLLQVRLKFLLRAIVRHLEVECGTSFHHLSGKLPFSASHAEVQVLAIIDHVEANTAVKVDKADSDALLALLGYDGPAGHESFSHSLWYESHVYAMWDAGEIFEKAGDILKSGEKVDLIKHLKELGLAKDSVHSDTRMGPPPLRLDSEPPDPSKNKSEEQTTAVKDRSYTSNLRDHDSGSPSSFENNSDDDQFVDASEGFS